MSLKVEEFELDEDDVCRLLKGFYTPEGVDLKDEEVSFTDKELDPFQNDNGGSKGEEAVIGGEEAVIGGEEAVIGGEEAVIGGGEAVIGESPKANGGGLAKGGLEYKERKLQKNEPRKQ